MEKDKFDDHIQEYIRANTGGDEIVTGWALCVSVQHGGVATSDGYIVDNSSGMPYHTQIGLLTAALEEKKNSVFMQTMRHGG